MQSMVWILTKAKEQFGNVQEPSRLIPFRLNRIQKYLIVNMDPWNIILKARQQGLTTFFLLYRLFLPAIVEGGIGSQLISQSNEFAQEHFAMVRRAYRMFGVVDPANNEANELAISLQKNLLHTQYSNRRELVFDMLDSKIRIASAEVEEAGQGITLHHVVASEYARWPGNPEATLSNMMGALAPGGTLDKESTANGAVGPFYEEFLRGMEKPERSASKAFFFPWYWSQEYQSSLTPAQAKELRDDINESELRMVELMRKEFRPVAYIANKRTIPIAIKV